MAATTVAFEAQKIDIEPNGCPIDAPIDLTIAFTLDQPVSSATWTVKFILDASFKRHTLDLGVVGPLTYAAGAHTFHWTANVDVAGVKRYVLLRPRDDVHAPRFFCFCFSYTPCPDCRGPRNVLNNMGLLTVGLRDGPTDIIDINMVVQVTKDAATGTLLRTIFNPLE